MTLPPDRTTIAGALMNTTPSEPKPTQAISVEIYDQTYHLRGQDPDYIHQLAAIVDAKMRAVASQGKTVDSLRVAVLASLNIADELVALEGRYHALAGTVSEGQGNLRTRAHSLSGLLDSVLRDERRIG
jgi:cell division protein ZapA